MSLGTLVNDDGTEYLSDNDLARKGRASGINDNVLARSLRGGFYGAGSQLLSTGAGIAEAVGADEVGAGLHTRSRGLRDEAALPGNSSRVGSYEQLSNDFSVDNALEYAGGLVGGSLPITAAGIVGGVATGGAGLVPAMLGAGAATLPFNMGEVVQKQQADPQAMQQGAGQRLGEAFLGGAGASAVESLVPGLVGRQIFGKGLGNLGKETVKQTLGRNALDIPMEGLTEGAGTAVKQFAANQDKDLDWNEIKEGAIGGAAAGSVFTGVGTAADLAQGVAPKAGEAFRSARTSINERLDSAKDAASKKLDETAPGRKVKSVWEDVADMAQKGREKFDDTVDKVLKGEELGIDLKEMATATAQRAREMMDISDNEHVKAATKWADEMLSDKGLDAAKRAEIMEAAKNITERTGQVAMATLKKAWDLGRAGAAKVDDFVSAVKEGYNEAKRADVDVDSRWADEPSDELVKLGYASKPAAPKGEPAPDAPTAPRPTLKDRKAFIDNAVAQGMSKDEARAAFIESMNEPESKKSEDYSGANAAVAKAIQESGIVTKRPDLFGSNDSINKMADALRVVAEQAAKGKLSERITNKMADVFGKDAPHMINTLTRVLAGANLDPAKTDTVFQNINNLNKATKTRDDLQAFMRESMTDEAFGSTMARDLPKLLDTLVKHARGELTKGSTPAETQAINETMAGILEDHFGPNADAVSKRIEQEAKQFGEPNMDRSGGAEFDEEVETDENGAEVARSEGDFDENGNRLDAEEQNITRFGLSKPNVSGHQRSVVNGAMMHKDSQYTEKYLAKLKEKHSTIDGEGRVTKTAEENGYDIRFEKAEGSDFGHIVVENRQDKDAINEDDIAAMKLDAKKYSKSKSRIEVGAKPGANGKMMPEHIIDATRLMDVMRGKAQNKIDRGGSTTVRQRMADGFAQGIAMLTEKYGSKDHPIVVADDVVIGYVNSKPVTWGEARKLDNRTDADIDRDTNTKRQVEIRAEFAKARGITGKESHNELIRAYVKSREKAGGDESLMPPKLVEYVELLRTHEKILTAELANGRDTQEASRLPAATPAPRAKLDSAGETARARATKKEEAKRGATYTDNNSFSSETAARKDADKDGNIHEAAAGMDEDDLIHRSNMDGSAHWAGNSKGIEGLNTLAGTIVAEWSKTPGVAAKKIVARAKKLVSVAASMSKADVQKLRMLAPDPMVNRRGGPVDYSDRYTANNTLAETLGKMTEKQVVKELTRRENLYDDLSPGVKRSDFGRILSDEIASLEQQLEGGKFGNGAGVQDSMTLSEAAPIINELARKYMDVIAAPNPANAGPVKPERVLPKAMKGTKQEANPIKFKNGEAVNGIKPEPDASTEPEAGHWETKNGKHFWVEGPKSPKPQAPAQGAAGKSGETRYSLEATQKASVQATNPNINNAQNYNAQDIKDHIEKVLAKSVKLAWASFTHAGEFSRTQAGDFIRLSIHALDPMSTAYHESLHAFFAQLRDAGATDIIDVVMKAASSQHVIDQLNDRFAGQPEVLKQLKDPEERAAYMYQMWAGDPKGFKVSIAAKTTFQKIKAFIRRVLGTWSNDERAQHIMSYFHEGKYARDMGSPSAVRAALMETHRSKILDTARSFTEPLGRLADTLVGAGGDRLRGTGIPALADLADIIKREYTAEGGDQGFINASRIAATKMRTEMGEILGDLNAEQIRDVMEAMQANKPAATPEGRIAVSHLKRFLKETHSYMKSAGVNIGSLGPDYFPRVWDTHYISQNQKAFRTMLEPYVRSGELKGTVDSLISRLVSYGGVETGIESRESTQPGMQHTKERLLAFIKPADAAQFVEKNLFATLSGYVNQAARKAEWTRRLGNGKLEQIIADAKSQGATKDDLALAEEYMKGVDGTLGDDISLTQRRLTGNIIVYQNVRLLPMAAFSMLVDPMGVMVGGGTLSDAWGTFKRGVKGITHTFDKNGGEANDQGTKWAELVGAVDKAMMTHVMGDIYSQGMVGGTAQKINNAFFKYNLVEGLNRNFRIGAVEAAVRFLGRHAGGLSGLGKSTHSKRWMRELGLRQGDIIMAGDHIALTEAEGLTAAQVQRVHAAINQWVDGAVLRPDAADKPIWMNDPHWALIAHLKQFVFTFQKVILGRVVHELRNGNYAPMMALASYVPIMIAADTAKGLLQGGGDTPEWKKGWGMSDYVGYGIQRAGLLGVGQFGFDVAEDFQHGGIGVGALTGPTIEQLTDGLQTIGGSRSAGSTFMDALPANALYKNMFNEPTDNEPMFTS